MPGRETVALTTPSSEPITTVIADDHALMRNGIRSLLGAVHGLDIVAEAETGLEAISAIKRTRPRLAVLDIKMPFSNGAEAFIEIRRWSPDTRVVVLTGINTRGLLRELVDAGVHGLFLKHGDPSEMASAIPAILAGRTVIASNVQDLLRETAGTSLTRRELQVLQAVAGGDTNAAIAEKLNISPKTVDSHRTRLMAKLDVHSTASLVALAMREGLIDTLA